MENDKSEAAKLIENIKIQLDLCDSVDTPYVCANIKLAAGYKKMQDLIIAKILQNKLTISEAILECEADLNPNSDLN
jgi:hypothetical protein